jgi:DNA polymerase-3 subunit alpha
MGLFELGATAAGTPRALAKVDAPEVPRRQLLAWEKELIGTFLSDHPLNELFDGGAPGGFAQIVELEHRASGASIRMIGLVTSVRRVSTRTNRTMAIVELEDLTGTIDLVAFPDCYDRFATLFEVDTILEIVAKVDRRGDQLQLICESASCDISLKPKVSRPRRALHLQLPFSHDVWNDIRVMQSIDEILKRYEGDDSVIIHLQTTDQPIVLRSRSRLIEWSDALVGELGGILGPGGVELEEALIAS